MLNSFRIYFSKLIALAALLIAMGSPMAATANDPARLELYWKIPLRHEPWPNRLPSQKGSLTDYARTTDDAIVLFNGNSFVGQISSLGTGVEQSHIEVDASLNAIAPANGGGAYVTGSIQHRHFGDILKLTESSIDTFVARINSSGEIIWQTDVGGAGFQVGTEVIELTGGNIVVAGASGRGMLLWSFSADGSLLWERHLGRAGGDIAPLSSGDFAVVGGEARKNYAAFVEDVKLWILDNSGEILHSVVVRKAINTTRGSHYLKTTIAADTDAIALSAAWPSFGDSKRLEIAKYNLGGDLQWTTVPEEQNCEPVPILEAEGDVIVACAKSFDEGSSRSFSVTRYSAEDGNSTKITSTLPDCQQRQTSVMIRILHSEPNQTLLLGSRPPNNVGQSCTWLGKISTPLQ